MKTANFKNWFDAKGTDLLKGWLRAKDDGNDEPFQDWVLGEYDIYREKPSDYEIPYHGIMDGPVRRDTRTLKFSTILKAGVLPAIPTTYDVDSQFPTLVDNNMYLNDKLGDCVIAARAHKIAVFGPTEYEIRMTDIPGTFAVIEKEHESEVLHTGRLVDCENWIKEQEK